MSSKFKSFLNDTYSTDKDVEERTLLEAGASLSRIMSKLTDDVDFVIITAFRKNYPYKTNQQRNNNLLREFRSMLGDNKAYGAYRLVGHWKECSVVLPDGVSIDQCVVYGGEINNALEEVWLVLNDKNNDKFFDTALKMAKKYDQDAIIAHINDDFGLFGKDGSKWESFGKVSKSSLSYGFKKIVELQGYTEVAKMRKKGRLANIVFEGISIPNPTNSSNMLFNAINILWK